MLKLFLYITLGFIGVSLIACTGITFYWLTKKSTTKDEKLEIMRIKHQNTQQE